jgi:hypothetical protein
MGPIGCPRMSVTNYKSTLRGNPRERRSQANIAASPMCLYTVAHLEAVTMPLWVQIPESLPTKVFPPICG